MAIRSFKRKDIEVFFATGKVPNKAGWVTVSKVAKRKLDMLEYAKELYDLKSPPNNRLEALRGDMKEYYSIRINDQWRIIFKWLSGPIDVDIIDYH